MTDDSLDSLFADEGTEPQVEQHKTTWPLLIVDDESEVHSVTRLALSDFNFFGQGLEFLSARSAAEAREILRERNDIALILLDVVMETDDAGLQLVDYIRNTQGNPFVRIVLRTGHPGQAPHLKVIREYDINDYKEKSELTADKLIASVHTALRVYRDLIAMDANRRGLEKVVKASGDLLAERSLAEFASGVLDQLTGLLFLDRDAVMLRTSGIAARIDEDLKLLAGIGRYSELESSPSPEVLHETVRARIDKALQQRNSYFGDNFYVGYFETESGQAHVLYVSGSQAIASPDQHLIELFIRNVAIAAENLHLHHELERSQQEIVYVLSEAIEKRSRETGNHVRRVGAICRMLAQAYGLAEKEANLVGLAAPLHDAGKIGIPDTILNKPGTHSEEERRVMRTHATIGHEILKDYDRPLLQAAAIIAEQHHEHWDGSGYPNGLEGEQIHIFGRIAAVADVFDALTSNRCYKSAWPVEDALQYVREQADLQFDPSVVSLLADNMGEVERIRARYPD